MARNPPKVWTPEEVETLRSMVKTHTWDQIAQHFNCHEDVVRLKAKRLNLTKYILNKADPREDQKLDAYSQRYGVSATVRKFKVTKDQVKNARKRTREKRERIREAFTPERYKNFRGACFKAIHQNGATQIDVEDFISWAVIKTLEGRNTQIKYLLFDYLDEVIGTRQSDSADVKKAEFYAKPIVEEFDPEAPGVVVEAPEVQREDSLVALAIRLRLKLVKRLIFLMVYREGYHQEEVALLLGVSPSRVSQILKAIETQLAASRSLKELLEK